MSAILEWIRSISFCLSLSDLYPQCVYDGLLPSPNRASSLPSHILISVRNDANTSKFVDIFIFIYFSFLCDVERACEKTSKTKLTISLII